MMRSAATDLDEVLALYARWGTEHYDEALSQVDHAAQVAAWAVHEGDDEAAVAAALLHDVGHLLVMEARDTGAPVTDEDMRHEAVGARYLAALFPAAVTGPIALHVQAKRYRCAVDPTEVDRLSPGSRLSLRLQGGPMTAAEVTRFEAMPAHAAAVTLRRRDDAGKVLGAEPAPFATYEPLLRGFVS
ncbi:MAG TPA: HD domain-containing protein [Iamia sp.]